MTQIKRLLTLLAASVWIFWLPACHKSADGSSRTGSGTLLSRIAADPDLTLLNAAIKRSRLDTNFTGGGPFSFFAPVDSALKNAGWTADRINQTSPQDLYGLFSYQILPGRISSRDLLGFLRQRFNSLNPNWRPFIVKNFYGIFFNGIRPAGDNLEVSDGVLYKMGRLSTPPTGNIYQTILNDPGLQLYAAVLRRHLPKRRYFVGSPGDLDTTYSGYYGYDDFLRWPADTPFSVFGSNAGMNATVFVPSDAAMKANGYTSAAIINQADPDSLRLVLSNSIYQGDYYSSDFMGSFFLYKDIRTNGVNTVPVFLPESNNMVYQSWGGYQVAPDARSIYAFNGYPDDYKPNNPKTYKASIIRPDIICSNGVIHVVDSVLKVPGRSY